MNIKQKSLPTLVELNQSSASRNVFCIHPAGGGVGFYEGLAKALEPYAKIYGLEEPFIYDNFAYGSLPELAGYHVDVIRSVQSEGPYTIFGYCSGGVISYEVACQLHLSGSSVDSVSMFGSTLVGGFDPENRERAVWLRDHLAARYGLQLGHLDWQRIETLSFAEVAATIVEDLERQGIGEKGTDLEWAGRTIQAKCLMRQASRKYRAPRSGLKVNLYQWNYLDPATPKLLHPWCDWNTLTTGKLTIVPPPERNGPEVDIMFPPYLDVTVERVKKVTFAMD